MMLQAMPFKSSELVVQIKSLRLLKHDGRNHFIAGSLVSGVVPGNRAGNAGVRSLDADILASQKRSHGADEFGLTEIAARSNFGEQLFLLRRRPLEIGVPAPGCVEFEDGEFARGHDLR